MEVRRVRVLLLWTLLHLDPVLGSSRRTGTSERLEAATGDAEEPAAAPPRVARIRAGPPRIRAETTRRAPPSAWQRGARPCTSARDDRVHAESGAGRRVWAQPRQNAALRGHVNVHGRSTRARRPLVDPHDYMVELYWSLGNGSAGSAGSAGTANTVTGLVDRGQDGGGPLLRRQRFLFHVGSLDPDSLLGAQLRILRKAAPWVRTASPGSPGPAGAPRLHLKLSTCPSGDRQAEPLQTKTADWWRPGAGRWWEVFDVWKVFEGPGKRKQQLCLELEAAAPGGGRVLDLRRLGFARPGRTTKEKALLLAFGRSAGRRLFFNEIQAHNQSAYRYLLAQRRMRRAPVAPRGAGGPAPPPPAPQPPQARCHRRRLQVNFREMGWDDWIIAPLEYQAFHCGGACDFPLRSHLEPTNHAIIQTLVHSLEPASTPASCCVPTRLSPVSILFIDSANNVVYQQYQDMAVEACGCR